MNCRCGHWMCIECPIHNLDRSHVLWTCCVCAKVNQSLIAASHEDE